MSTQIQSTDLTTSLQKISDKSGKPLSEVQDAYKNTLTTLPPTIKGDVNRQKYTLKLVNRDLVGNARSPAIAFEGIVIGAGGTRDLMTNIRQQAIEAYNTNQQAALASGSVKIDNGKVVPLDNRKEINGQPNKRFGEPRPEHAYLREVILAVRMPGEQKFTAGKLVLRGDQCSLGIPMGKLVKFRALGELDNTSNEFKLRSSTTTQFEILQSTPIDEVLEIIETTFAAHAKTLGECMAYHKSLQNTPAFWDRYVITEGTVSYIKFATDPTKNHLIVLDDDTLDAGQSVTVWVPNNLRHLIDFGRDSVVTVVGQTSIGKGWDSEKRIQTDEERLMLNGFSIFGKPGLTTIVEEQGADLI